MVSIEDFQYKTERDEALALTPNSYAGVVLRVFCRPAGTRRWIKFLLVPDEGEGYEELEAKAADAARVYLNEIYGHVLRATVEDKAPSAEGIQTRSATVALSKGSYNEAGKPW